MVAFLDYTVAAGKALAGPLWLRVLSKEMRRQAAEQDVKILRQEGAANELDDLVEWTVGHMSVED